MQRAPDKAESMELPQRRLSPLRPADSYQQMNEAMRVGWVVAADQGWLCVAIACNLPGLGSRRSRLGLQAPAGSHARSLHSPRTWYAQPRWRPQQQV